MLVYLHCKSINIVFINLTNRNMVLDGAYYMAALLLENKFIIHSRITNNEKDVETLVRSNKPLWAIYYEEDEKCILVTNDNNFSIKDMFDAGYKKVKSIEKVETYIERTTIANFYKRGTPLDF